MESVEGQDALLADRIAAAMSAGKLDEFLKQEMPDNEYARNLATMMMGMTGMMPFGNEHPASAAPEPGEQSHGAAAGSTEPAGAVPEEVIAAVQGGDVNRLMDLLRQEHNKRMPEAGPSTPEAAASPSQTASLPAIDKDLIDALIQIARDNSVTLDWMILRAIKIYVQEYQKTGKL